MRASINFDTLEYVDELKKGGFTQSQAETLTKANAKAFSQLVDVNDLVTKTDLKDSVFLLKTEISEIKYELKSFFVKGLITTISVLVGLQTLFHFWK